jgi:pyrroloquinoline quinone biosynthesis protein D
MTNDHRVFQVAKDISYQSMGPGEQTVILALKTGNLYTCNDTSEAFLKALDGRSDLGQVAARLAEQFDATEGQLLADLSELAEQLLAEGIIVPVGRDGLKQ